MDYPDVTIIKAINNGRFEIALIETANGEYRILHTFMNEDKEQDVEKSESIKDYATASYLFDLKLQELEGN